MTMTRISPPKPAASLLLRDNWLPSLRMLAAAACTAVLGGAALLLYVQYQGFKEDAERDAQIAVTAISAYADDMFDAVNHVLRQTEADIKSDDPELRLADGAKLHGVLVSESRGLRIITGLNVIDANGNVRASSLEHPVRTVNVSDRDYFAAQAKDPAPSVHLGAPILSRLTQRPAITAAYPITAFQGSNRGLIVASVDGSQFQTFMKRLSSELRLMLIRADGTVLASNVVDTNNLPLAWKAFTTPPRANSRVEWRTSAEGASELVATAPLGRWPVYAAAVQTEADALARWYVLLRFVGGSVVLLLSAIGLVSWRYAKRMRAEHALREQLETEHERFRVAFDTAGHGVWDWDIANDIVTWSPNILRLLGYSEDELTGGAHLAIVHPDDRSERETLLHDIRTGRRDSLTHQIRLKRKDGGYSWFAAIGQVDRRGPAGVAEHVTGTLTDTTPLVAAEEHAREIEQRLAAIVDTTMDAIITTDSAQNIVVFNKSAESVFGYRAADIIGKPLVTLLPAGVRNVHARHVDNFAHGAGDSRRMSSTRIVRGLRANGEEFPIDASISHVTAHGQRFFTAIVRDVSEQMRAEKALATAREELRQISIASQGAREQEKRRIARELHDEFGQGLTALKMDLAWLDTHVSAGDPQLRSRIQTMRGILDATVAASRRIAADLRPMMLDDLGLEAALEWLVTNIEARCETKVALNINGDLSSLREPIASTVYRIVQEALNNVVKHARAKSAEVTITLTADNVELTVADDGIGASQQDQRKVGSFGLIGIRERVYLLGGTVSVEPAAPGGTVIAARLPLEYYREP